jgi:pimeloyl-ACP methyl ester carboxylesterase
MLAGHSMGGWIAQALAAKAPDRVGKLLLLNTWATSDPKIISLFQQVCKAIKLGQLQEAMQMQLPLLVHPSRHEDPALMQDLQTMITSFPLDVLIQQLEAMINDHSSLHHHAAITSPTLILHSKDDALFPHEHQPLLNGIENSRLAVIENCGHASTMEQPQVVSECMRSFILD